MRFRLVSVINTPVNVGVFKTVQTRNGTYKKHMTMRLEPGLTYDTENDPVLERSIQTLRKRKVRWTQELENKLKEAGIDYTAEYCKSCGGRIKKIEFSEIEEV